MSWAELLELEPRSKLVGWRQVVKHGRKQLRRSVRRSIRRTRALVARQYYVSTAFADARQAFRLNEDIALTCLLIMALLTLAMVVTAGNILYTVVMATFAFSVAAGVNIGVLIGGAMAVLAVMAFWVMCLEQSMLAIALLEGARHKVKRSLRRTVRLSLHYTTRVAAAWTLLVATALVPALVVLAVTFTITALVGLTFAQAVPYLVACCAVAGIWFMTVLANFSLAPWVAMFETPRSWRETFVRSYQLVKRKGRLSILSTYLLCVLLMCALYGIGQVIQLVIDLNTLLVTAAFSWMVGGLGVAILTAIYRKRTLARSR